jgi:hypothetical protein
VSGYIVGRGGGEEGGVRRRRRTKKKKGGRRRREEEGKKEGEKEGEEGGGGRGAAVTGTLASRLLYVLSVALTLLECRLVRREGCIVARGVILAMAQTSGGVFVAVSAVEGALDVPALLVAEAILPCEACAYGDKVSACTSYIS